MKIISWNVAGINACVKKGLASFMKKENADIYCFQEVKANSGNFPKELGGLGLDSDFSDYFKYNFYADKKGYSGVSVFTKIKPLSVIYGISDDKFDSEGRVLTLEFLDFYLINAYFPHAHRELKRLDFKLDFNNAFLKFISKLKKPVVIASDFNVAHKEIDLKNSKQNMKNAGFTPQERKWFDDFLKSGFIDTFREFNPDSGNYTWWSYMHNARKRNIGWRIDYFVISSVLRNRLFRSDILKDVFGSDHCPIVMEMK